MSISAALGTAAAAALLLAAWRDPQRRAWALVAIAGGVLYLALRGLPPLATAGYVAGEDWNWGGHLLALAGMLALAALLVRRAGLAPRELGLAGPANLGVAVRVCAAALLVSYPLHVITAGRIEPIPARTWLFLATMPGLAEEVAFRGALQGAIGWIGAAVIFALLHFGPGAPFRLWSGYALLGGLTFGVIAFERQALLAPILGHLIVNLVQLRRLADVHRGDTAGLLPDD